MNRPMTSPDTAPLMAEVCDALSKSALWAADNNHAGIIQACDRAVDMLTTLTTQLAERDAELARATAERDDYRDAYEDTKRLARMIDIAMHGEEGAAQQASLCDLVGPAEELSDALVLAQTRIAALTEALVEIDNAPSPDHWVPEYQHVKDVASLALTTDKEPT